MLKVSVWHGTWSFIIHQSNICKIKYEGCSVWLGPNTEKGHDRNQISMIWWNGLENRWNPKKLIAMYTAHVTLGNREEGRPSQNAYESENLADWEVAVAMMRRGGGCGSGCAVQWVGDTVTAFHRSPLTCTRCSHLPQDAAFSSTYAWVANWRKSHKWIKATTNPT